MRVGIVCPYSFDQPGGVQAHVLDLAEALRARGHFVQVIGPARESTELPDYVIKGGRSFPIRYNGSVARLAFGPLVHRRVQKFLAQGRFDVLHIHEPNSPSFSLHALLAARGPIVATYHASAASSLVLRLARRWLTPYLEKIRAGIAVSELARRWQVEQLGRDPVLIPNGIDTARFSAAPTSSEKVEIVFLGRIDEPRKGLEILLRALEGLEREVRVTVIGGGAHREVPGVDFVGRVSEEDKARILGRADIYVAPNTGGESFGIVLVEAMAAGCAVVASDLEAFARVLDGAGRLFPVGSTEDLTAELRKLIDDPAARRTLIEKGRRRAHRFDWDTVAGQVLRVYETVADGTTVGVEKRR
ncbi:alpha-(1-2)-phosphatidylinositol mannosyltransferase [Corynebacterium yudongzhengii]|uniref:Glycosyltransferase family 1 protein n=1 Tax=Corynebacterium yudongzhengii TaxID=2080740 RepID=A0A2U1T586_9CORY|nr:glycosyltransferase family 4 protein [Corynebacterium yudongzhengii]AWB81793.1 alpha-(1-2)-phosphatidylinositol mannosyltransferase [Corynebacterium yudongzhengii]PWC01058.1 glycosyltransferase family 1 protein [Corynebacterium yudongzhengii]